MLSYQHDYHAGNHADVLKHVVLTLLIGALQRKPKPLRVIDTHAGSGGYDVTDPLAQRNREHEGGIGRLLDETDPPPEVRQYLDMVRESNMEGPLRWYPGSPEIARRLARPDDQVEAFELHPQALKSLRNRFAGDRQVHVHRRDAFEGLMALLPPPERRGVVLIDPAYESEREFGAVLALLADALERWPGGVYAVWYPLVPKPGAARFVARLEALSAPKLFQTELTVAPPGAPGLRGSGVIVVNLPFGLDAPLRTAVGWLHSRLAAPGIGAWKAHWLRQD